MPNVTPAPPMSPARPVRAGRWCNDAMTMAASREVRWSARRFSGCSPTLPLGRVDIVVVYKVDRLTRSLLDFAKLVEAFDQAGTSFVSVTQSFNTTTSMGRLTLNMLLSLRPVRKGGHRRAHSRQDCCLESTRYVDGRYAAAWLQTRRPQPCDRRQRRRTRTNDLRVVISNSAMSGCCKTNCTAGMRSSPSALPRQGASLAAPHSTAARSTAFWPIRSTSVMNSEAVDISIIYRHGKYSGLQGLMVLSGKSLQTPPVACGPSFHFRRFMISSSG